MKTIVTLESMKFHAFHGVMDEERITGGTFPVDGEVEKVTVTTKD